MKSNLSRALEVFFSPATILPFLVGSLFLALLGNATYDILKNTIGTETSALFKIAILALVVFIACVASVTAIITRRVNRLHRDRPVIHKRQPKKYPGLILLVSQVESCRTAIAYHQPRLQQCWLICSVQSMEKAQEIMREFPQVCIDDPIVVNDIYDPIEFRDVINGIYADRLPVGWKTADVIADYAGMTAHASVGMVLANLMTDRPLQYTPANVDRVTGKIVGSLEPIEITLTWTSTGDRNKGNS
jgi:hypothetical protein